MFRRSLFIAFVLLGLTAGPATAGPITFLITGQVTQVTHGTPPSGISAGSEISLLYTFDGDALDASLDPTYGDYKSIGAPYGITGSIGGYGFSSSTVQVEAYNPLSGQDQYGVYGSGSFNGGRYLMSAVLGDPTRTALSSDALPLTAPDASLFSSSYIGFTNYPFGPGDAIFQIRAQLTSVTAVPESGSTGSLLLLSTLLGAGMQRWRKLRT